jgi:hypothetical protein
MVHYMTNARQMKAEAAAANDIEMELEAMNAVGLAIGDLRDHDAQVRIVRWATERFHADDAAAANGTPPEAGSADPGLSLDNIDDLFGNSATAVNAQTRSVDDDLDGLFEDDVPVGTGPRSMDNLEKLFDVDAHVMFGPRSMENFDGLFESAAVADISPLPVETLEALALFEKDAPVPTAVSSSMESVDSSSMESLDTLFEADAHVMSTVVDAPVMSTASDVPVVCTVVDAPVVTTVVDPPVVDIVQPSAQPEAELGSLVHDFVVDFQLLAAQLQDFNADPAC